MNKFRELKFDRNYQVTKSLEKYAKLIGYDNSKYEIEFLEMLHDKYIFLHKVPALKRLTDYWEKNSKGIIEKESEIKNELNNHIITRRQPNTKEYSTSHISISDIANFVFCPVTFSIRQTYETISNEEMAVSVLLKKNKHLEEFLEALRNKRRIEFFFKSFIERCNDDTKIRIKKLISIDSKVFSSKYFELMKITKDGENIELILVAKRSRDYFYKEKIKEFEENVFKQKLPLSITIPKKGYNEFVYRYDYGDILGSKLIFKGYEHPIINPFFSEDGKLAGIPDYIFQKESGERFLVLEKHKWNNKKVETIFHNHLIQAACYIHYLKTLNINYGYVVYFSQIFNQGPYIFKVTLTDQLIKTTESAVKEVIKFKTVKLRSFNSDTEINVNKCFGCSDNVYCFHKSGNLSSISIPYNKD